MIKRIVIGIFCLFTAFAVFASGESEETITFWTMPNAPDSVHLAWMEEKIAEFYEETGIRVEYETVGWGDAWQRISTAIATGEGVDVFQVGTTWNPQFAATGGLSELNIDNFGGNEAFMSANLDSAMYEGDCYGIPWFAETRVLFYNEEMFDAAGVEPPQTQAELLEAGEAIVAEFGEGSAISLAGTNAWDLIHNWAIILWSRGGDVVNDSYTEAAFNGSAGVNAMNWYIELFRRGLAADACAEYNQPQADSAFINGNVAMCYMGPWNIANIEDENPDLSYGIVEPPAGPEVRASFSGGSNLVILGASEHQEAAQQWINFLMETENLVDYCQNLTHMLPAAVDAYNDPYYQSGMWATFKETLDYATAYPALSVWGDIENAIQTEFRNIITDYVNGNFDENTAQEYLNTAADHVNAALENE
ncbi:MAG: extracellular solute-binding protein [Spirochaetia bacterium]